MCSHCQLLCCRLISDCVSIVISESTRTASLKTRKVKVDVWVIIFFFTVSEIDFSGFVEAWDSKRILHTL